MTIGTCYIAEGFGGDPSEAEPKFHRFNILPTLADYSDLSKDLLQFRDVKLYYLDLEAKKIIMHIGIVDYVYDTQTSFPRVSSRKRLRNAIQRSKKRDEAKVARFLPLMDDVVLHLEQAKRISQAAFSVIDWPFNFRKSASDVTEEEMTSYKEAQRVMKSWAVIHSVVETELRIALGH